MNRLKFAHKSAAHAPAPASTDLVEYKRTDALELKSFDDTGKFTGYASTFRTEPDSDGDIIRKGAFARTIEHHKGAFPILFSHDQQRPCGMGLSAVEDEKGLLVEGQLNMETQDGREAHALMKQGAMKGLSIGYSVPKAGAEFKDGTRFINEVKLWEYSPVVFPADDAAGVTAVKIKTSVAYQNLPLAPESRAWDKSTAEAGVKAWATTGEKVNWAKYRKAFLWFDDAKAEEFGSYHFPIAEIIDGKLTAVPHAIFSAAGDLPKSSLSAEDQAKAKTHLKRYYAKMGKDDPWKPAAAPAETEKSHFEGRLIGTSAENCTKADDFNAALSEATAMDALYDMRWNMESALSDSICDIQDDESLDVAAKKQAITISLSQYASAMASWWGRYLDVHADDYAEHGKSRATPATKTFKLSAETVKCMKDSMDYMDSAMDHHRDAVKCIKSAHLAQLDQHRETMKRMKKSRKAMHTLMTDDTVEAVPTDKPNPPAKPAKAADPVTEEPKGLPAGTITELLAPVRDSIAPAAPAAFPAGTFTDLFKQLKAA